MKKLFQTVRKKKWALGIVILCFTLFLIKDGYQRSDISHADDMTIENNMGEEIIGTYKMRLATEIFTLTSGLKTGETAEWVSLNPDVLEIVTGTGVGDSVTVNALDTGRAALLLTVTDADGNRQSKTISIEVVFSINEYLIGPTNARIVRVNEEDERRSLVMDPDATLQFGKSAKNDTNMLNLIFGDATQADWTSSNTDIIRISTSGGVPRLQAVGAGRARLRVTATWGTQTYEDEIWVYVRPRVEYNGQELGVDGVSSVRMENGEKLNVSTQFRNNPQANISDKLVWAISKDDGNGTSELVRDSFGKGNYLQDANLKFNRADNTYTLDAKAGIYTVQFYVAGSYSSYEDSQLRETPCAPVSFEITVNSAFTDKDVTININGRYNLSDAFNISLSDLQKYFNYDLSPENNQNNCIGNIGADWIARAQAKGKAVFTVTAHGDGPAKIPGITSDTVTVTITVTDSFSLNFANTTMAVDSTLDLGGIIGSGQYADPSAFEWSTSDTAGTYIDLDTNGQYATVTAKKITPVDSPVEVSLAWTDEEGVTQVATCYITIINTVTNITLDQTDLKMEVGEVAYLDTGLSGSVSKDDLAWTSTNENIVSISTQNNGAEAKLTAGPEVGVAYITVINKKNNAYATCKVTVSAAITELTIDKGENLDTYLSAGFIRLKAIYKPDNATATEMKWTSSRPNVATVDENGLVTLLDEGYTVIRVQPVNNPHNVWAECTINVIENPITKITPDVTNLEMIAGDSYAINAKIEPEDTTDPTLTWVSGDESVAIVEGGLVTAVAPGTTWIKVSGGEADAIIQVHVRNRLISIDFANKDRIYTIKKGSTIPLSEEIVFNPSEDINKKLTWATSDDSVVTVDEEGNITGVEEGMAMITCISEDIGITGAITCQIRVIPEDIIATDFQLDPAEGTVYIGSTLQINAVFDPVTTTDQSLTWSSSNEALATVDANGLVTGVAEGDVTITAVYSNTPDGIPWVRNCNIKVEKAPVPVTGVTVAPTSQEVFIGSSFTLNVTIQPADATNKNVVFESSDTSIATVDNAGVVTGVASGGAVIVCRTVDGGHIASCNVSVIQGVRLELDPPTREIALGKTFTIKKKVYPANSDKTAAWKSSNTKIATVNKNGKVKGIKKGKCTITCTLTKYNAKATCRVTVASLRSTIKLNKTSIRIGKGQRYRLKATVWSNNSTKPSVKWKSSNKKIASVSANGTIKAKKLGYTTIVATTKDKVKAKARCKVRVIRRATGVRIKPNYAVCHVGGTTKLTAVVKPKNATIKKVSWKSSDTSIAVVEGGTVRGIAEGSVTITATVMDGSRKKATCMVKVLEQIPATSVVVAQTELTMKQGDSAKLSYSVLPSNTSDRISFASDNKRVATVNANGTVKAMGTGSCTITILTSGGVTSTVTVNVVALNRYTLTMRQYDSETLRVLGTSETVTWYSSNSRVATVENGRVVGRSKGTTYIYAYVKGCKMACRVTIIDIP